MKDLAQVYVWGFIGIFMGCLIIKSDDYIYPQIKHWDDRNICKDNAETFSMQYTYSAYQNICKVKYNNIWVSFKEWDEVYSPRALAAQKRLGHALLENQKF